MFSVPTMSPCLDNQYLVRQNTDEKNSLCCNFKESIGFGIPQSNMNACIRHYKHPTPQWFWLWKAKLFSIRTLSSLFARPHVSMSDRVPETKISSMKPAGLLTTADLPVHFIALPVFRVPPQKSLSLGILR